MKKNKVLMFYNPYSGNGVFKDNLDLIIEKYQDRGFQLVPVRGSRDQLLDAVMKTINQDEYRQIIIAGGDGTINICVNAMVENGINLPLAIFPSGTANDFATYFNMPDTIEGMIDVALDENIIPADVGVVNGKCFVNVAAIGHMVDVSQKTNPELKNTLGRFAYYLTGLTELSDLRPVSMKLTTPDRVYVEKMFFMLVMNGTSAGGFRKVSPDSEVNDGLLNVILFRKMPIIEMAPLALKVINGDHLEDHRVLSFKTNRLLVESDEDIPTDVDGEHGKKLPLQFDVLHDRINIHVLKEEKEYYEKIKNSSDFGL